MTSSLLQGKQFFCRDWVFPKIIRCLEPPNNNASTSTELSKASSPSGVIVETGSTTSACSPCRQPRPSGTIIMGGPGCGKTALCCELIWPTVPLRGGDKSIGKRSIAYYFCQAHDVETLSVANFILCIADQISRSSLISNSRGSDADHSRQDPVQHAIRPDPVLCETDPDQAFKVAVIEPLRAASTPSETLFILVDSLDESYLQSFSERATGSRTIAELLAAHHHLLPSWLYLVCTSRKQTKSITKLFAGFRKISLDDQRKAYVVRDVQQYILCRLDREDRLRHQLSRETAEMLNQLHIKSNACMLYLEKVLDGVVDGFIRLEEIRDMPGTLNGLYLWLCQRLFSSKSFTVVRPILNVIFAARRPLADLEIYSCVVTHDTTLTFDEFKRRMTILGRILIEGRDGTRILFHHSFAEWLLDVKYCTQRYLCTPAEGHSMLALSFTLHAETLDPTEVHHFAFHIAKCSLSPPLESFHFPLWLVASGANVVDSLSTQVPREQIAVELLLRAGARLPTDEALVSSITGMSSVDDWDTQEDADGIPGRDAQCDDLDSNGRTALCNAAFQGNVHRVKMLLEQDQGSTNHSHGVGLETSDASGQTALCLAARHGHSEVMALLLGAGAAVDHADHDGWTSLRSAAWGGHHDVVVQLLEAGAVVDYTDRDGRTALRAAAWSGHLDIVSTLLDHGARVNHVDNEGRTALIAAAYMGHADIVDLLLTRGADVNHADVDGRTALSVAALCIPASRSHSSVVTMLLERGAMVDHVDKDGMTPFCVAAYEGHADICEILLENEADIDHVDTSGRSAVEGAVCMGHADVVQLLLFWGAYVDMIDSDGRTVLCSAAQQGNIDVVQLLLDRGLDETHRDNYGWSPLHIGAFEGHSEVVQTLLEAGAHVLECDNDGRIPLHLAAQEGNVACVAALLDAGSPIETHGHDGKTALRLAILEGHAEVVLCLLGYGADMNHVDSDRRSALYILAAESQPTMIAMLLDNGADPSISDVERRSPLHVAAWSGNIDAVRLLLDYGADADARDRELRTPLQSAAWCGHANCVEMLLCRGAEVDHACAEGATALAIAVQEGHEAVVRVLLRHGANVNHADVKGRTPMVIALARKHAGIIDALQDSCGLGAAKIRAGSEESSGKGRNNNERLQIYWPQGQRESVAGSVGGCQRENGDQSKRSEKRYSGPPCEPKQGNRANRLSGDSHFNRAEISRRLAHQSERLACYASESIDGRGSVTTSPVVTSGVSSIDTKYSCSTANVFNPSRAVVTTSSSGLPSCPSNHSSSKSSGIQIGSNSTNMSSSSGEGVVMSAAAKGSGAGVGCGNDLETSGGTPLTFTQELQQCSGPRSRKHRSLTRILSAVTNPSGAISKKSEGKAPFRGVLSRKTSDGAAAPKFHALLPSQSSSSPARLKNSPREKSDLCEGESRDPGGSDAVWMRRSVQKQSSGDAVENLRPLVRKERTDGGGSHVFSPSRGSGQKANPKNLDNKISKQRTKDSGGKTPAEISSLASNDRPNDLPIKKETPL